MIQNRAVSLLSAYRKVRKLDFGGATRVLLGATPHKTRLGFTPGKRDGYSKTVSNAKFAGNNWLEYHFGWEPLVKDVYASMEILHNPVKKFASIHGSAKTSADYSSGVQNGGSVSSINTYKWTAQFKQGAFINAIQDPQLHTLEQLGVINPAVLAWEVVPFSFVVDWFVNVGDVLRSYSDFAGMTLTNSWSISIVRCTNFCHTWLNPGYSAVNGTNRYSSGNGLRVVRSSGLTGPVLNVRPFRLPSVTRAATAVSLLTQALKGR
jgi:hypothetical protein